MSQNFNHLITR